MPTRRIEKNQWQTYFDRVSQQLTTSNIDVEVDAPELGAQQEASHLPVVGFPMILAMMHFPSSAKIWSIGFLGRKRSRCGRSPMIFGPLKWWTSKAIDISRNYRRP